MNHQPTDVPQTNYYSNIIAPVLFHKRLEPGAKLLYAHISSLCNERGYCWASNDYFAEKHDVDTRTIQRWLLSLSKENYVYVHVKKDRFFTQRKVFIDKRSYDEFKKSLRNDISVAIETTKVSPSTRHFCHPNIKEDNTKEEKEHTNTPADAGAAGAAGVCGLASPSCEKQQQERPPSEKGPAPPLIDSARSHLRVPQPPCVQHGSHVRLTAPQYEQLCEQHGKSVIDQLIEEMNDYCAASKPKGYADYAAALRQWVRKRKTQQTQRPGTHADTKERIRKECNDRWIANNGNPNDDPNIMRFA